jgi:hypothetical protein
MGLERKVPFQENAARPSDQADRCPYKAHGHTAAPRPRAPGFRRIGPHRRRRATRRPFSPPSNERRSRNLSVHPHEYPTAPGLEQLASRVRSKQNAGVIPRDSAFSSRCRCKRLAHPSNVSSIRAVNSTSRWSGGIRNMHGTSCYCSKFILPERRLFVVQLGASAPLGSREGGRRQLAPLHVSCNKDPPSDEHRAHLSLFKRPKNLRLGSIKFNQPLVHFDGFSESGRSAAQCEPRQNRARLCQSSASGLKDSTGQETVHLLRSGSSGSSCSGGSIGSGGSVLPQVQVHGRGLSSGAVQLNGTVTGTRPLGLSAFRLGGLWDLGAPVESAYAPEELILNLCSPSSRELVQGTGKRHGLV